MNRIIKAFLTTDIEPIRFVVMLNSFLMMLLLLFGPPFFETHNNIVPEVIHHHHHFLVNGIFWGVVFAFHSLFIASSFFIKWNPKTLFFLDGALGLVSWGLMIVFRVAVSLSNTLFPIPFLISAATTIFLLQWWVLIRHLCDNEQQNECSRQITKSFNKSRS